MAGSEYQVLTMRPNRVAVVIAPDSYPGITGANLGRADHMVREIVVDRGAERVIRSKDWGSPIGESSCLRLRASDVPIYARLKGRNVFGKFVRDRLPEQSSYLTIQLKLVCGEWRLVRVFVGEHAPAFPGDPNAAKGSRAFWATHAMLWGSIPVDKVNNSPFIRCPSW